MDSITGRVSQFFQHHLFNPFTEDLSRTDQVICAIASGVLFVLSIGLIHLGCAVYFWANRKVNDQAHSQNSTNVKTTKTANLSEPKKESFIEKFLLSNEQLEHYGLSSQEYQKILTYYSENLSELTSLTDPTHIRKNNVNGLPRSLVFVPAGPRKGLHVLCKDNGVVEVGLGAYNRVTLMLHVDLKKEEVGRSGKRIHVKDRELKANVAYSRIDLEGDHFVTGTAVHYRGPWSQRRGRKIGENKIEESKQKDVDKVLLIMDHIPGGELFEIVKNAPDKRPDFQTQKKNIKICLDMAQGLVKSHAADLVNLDNKPENIFLGTVANDGSKSDPKIGDFGFVYKNGTKLSFAPGSLGYLSPEVQFVIDDFTGLEKLDVIPANEMWILGCIFSLLTKGFGFYSYTHQYDRDEICFILEEGEQAFEKKLGELFPLHTTEETLDSVIYGCLRFNPENRLTAKEVVDALKKLYRKTPEDAHPSDLNWLKNGYAYA